jgi:hypothetical protein
VRWTPMMNSPVHAAAESSRPASVHETKAMARPENAIDRRPQLQRSMMLRINSFCAEARMARIAKRPVVRGGRQAAPDRKTRPGVALMSGVTSAPSRSPHTWRAWHRPTSCRECRG